MRNRLHLPVPFASSKVVVAILFVLLVGGIVGMRGPVAHAEPISCSAHQIGATGRVNLSGRGFSGYAEGWLYGYYSTYNGSYCGYMTAKSQAHLNPGSAWGTLRATVYDCSSHIKAQTPGKALQGGGSGGLDYYTVNTSNVYQNCGLGFASVIVSGYSNGWGLGTGNHWA